MIQLIFDFGYLQILLLISLSKKAGYDKARPDLMFSVGITGYRKGLRYRCTKKPKLGSGEASKLEDPRREPIGLSWIT